MAVESIYRFHSLRFNTVQFGQSGATTASFNLGGVSTSAVNPNPEVMQEFVDGHPVASASYIKSFAEELSFSTNNIDTAIDLIGSSGTCMDFPGSVEVFYARYDSCTPGPAPGSVHRRVTVSSVSASQRGLIYGKSLNCDHRGDAEYAFSIAPQSDGVNSPLVFADNVALPTGVIDNTHRYTLGPVEIGGVLIDGIKSVNTDFGISVERESADSAIFDEYFTISKLASKLSISGINPSWWDANKLGSVGKVAEHMDTSIILRRRLTNGAAGFEPRTANRHFRITANGLAVPSGFFDSSGASPITSSFDLYTCLLYTSPSPRDQRGSRMPSSA